MSKDKFVVKTEKEPNFAGMSVDRVGIPQIFDTVDQASKAAKKGDTVITLREYIQQTNK